MQSILLNMCKRDMADVVSLYVRTVGNFVVASSSHFLSLKQEIS